VQGSHGIRPASRKDWPVLIAEPAELPGDSPIQPTQLYEIIKRRVLG
jgi:hypothetical protein